ncbi:glycosyltransferase family 4 protein [Candidatus Nitrospira allomarina]|uniref:Glycosyltransferase family 4 protein n=1 Tax=Candidatus Nitrospira allomarina TaxID=3020900 RepID=A0AA96GG85_9BACT|nr:glycosyltransferase family 4 protein [Candidatus Nitrospira allomarina]WNM57994.1 glycosyltransferase family 4 protein [Candidatus Nitrospira allomarina]
MKVLFLTYPRIGLNRGGLQIQIEETAKGLVQRGVEVIFYDPWRNQIPDVDICHVFSIDGSAISHVQRSLATGKPVIVSSVLNLFHLHPLLMRMKVLSSAFIPGMYSDLKRANLMLHAASRVIALNENERNLLSTVFSLPSERIATIPNGLKASFATADPLLFEEKYGVKDFVLNVASIEERKNQLTLICAMKRMPYPLVIIGNIRSEQEEYISRCRAQANKQVIFTGSLAHDDPILASAYRAAKLFVLPSFSEVMPLSLYEASIAGCRVIASKNVPVASPLQHLISVFDPHSPEGLASLITTEMEKPRSEELQSVALEMPSWQQVCEQIHDCYESALSGMNSREGHK